ncbi:SUPPRESSOR OF AUXIN RESISTANCE1, NUCLEOPORIN 160, ARABIDOPSIS NUCLEOPORIN 160 [Hibiscus trionum]|uniref:SUPPRESSOR OF AUXIN RESISTANCE1, NUCLEOPORIN 160, ARABIDOPSIS NUCLEOPORIN 160 n=2 Tax=Hibiscus trionum TaxID=183268 RepID=A0A9W7H9B8_HIBTR|nr:SUPPRESSOR OF AUXIN RESISTANCE1, NUCLEOPORIN 160, ARABIDOPSIS NUCLEOPORIN 160 [Hibiscus trionum]
MMVAGMEVPVIGSDSIKWIDLTIPSSIFHLGDGGFAPLTVDSASATYIDGDDPFYLICRFHMGQPNVLEIFKLSQEFPHNTGLRLSFAHPLSPFAFVSAHPTKSHYLLYTVTVSGIAYFIKLSKDLTSFCSMDELVELDLRAYSNSNEPITCIAANPGCLLLGRNDGSVTCFQLGSLHQTAPGFVSELRDDSGVSLGRFWGFMSRGRVVGAVEDLIIKEILGKRVVFVLHHDGILRAWDLLSRNRILSHAMVVPTSLEGATPTRLWLGDSNNDSNIVPLAILYKSTLEVGMEMIYVYSLCCCTGDRIILSVDSSVKNFPLDEGGCIDVKLTSDRIWILKDNGLASHHLFNSSTMEEAHCYALHEEFIADQLLQSSEHASDDLISITSSIFSSGKDQIVPFVSSIFFRRLLHPGVYHNIVLRSTFLDYSKHWTDNEFQSLTVDGLKKEILSIVEHESMVESPIPIFQGWKNFCCRYFQYWCKKNAPSALIIQSTSGAVGLIRKHSVSFFRSLESTELLIDGLSEDLGNLGSFGLDLFDDNSDRMILFEVLRCVMNISQQLGKAASFVFYESFVGRQSISSEEIIPRLVKILGTGYGPSTRAGYLSGLGSDVALEREQIDHINLRKFSVDMLLSLHDLCKKAASWKKILDVLESYLQYLVPKKISQNSDAETLFCLNKSILVHASCQIAKVMFESALDILLFVSYLMSIGAQINMVHDDINRIQVDLVPMIEEIISEWLIILFFCTTPSESPANEDFSSQLSLLQIDNKINKRSWREKLGKCDFTLASLLLLNNQSSYGYARHLSLGCLLNPHEIITSVQKFASWIVWGNTGEVSSSFLRRSTEIATTLLRNGQYDAVEYLLAIAEANVRNERNFRSVQDTSGDLCLLQHLLGCCLVAQTQRGLHGILKGRKVGEAVSNFFRAASGEGAAQALQSLSDEAGLSYLGFNGHVSAAWTLHYYQWVMQLFEQYNISDGACQFALAALEQVDELDLGSDGFERDSSNESTTIIKGRLWANVFKFTLDLNLLNDAYCAIISNPDEESKYICLRRFIIVLYECGAIKILCNGQLPLIGLADKVERELAWKAERTDILAKPNPYKLLYAFEIHRHNWRKAASYMYLYSARLRTDAVLKDQQHMSITLQERLNALSAAINALHLVHPAYAWIDPLPEGYPLRNDQYPRKKAKTTVKEQSVNDVPTQRQHFCIDIKKLEYEIVLTSAEYLLSLANVKWTYSGINKAPSDLVELLVLTNLYDMAFSVILKFWKDSELKRELEKIFSTIALKCCPSTFSSSRTRPHSLLLTSSKDEVVVHSSPDMELANEQKANCHWETLEHYLEKYKYIHPRLPVVVAETLLRTDPHIELPLWLVKMFKENQRESSGRMAGPDPSPASLFRLYVDYGRYTEATNLFLEYVEVFASTRPVDIINRKRASAVWFPYNTVERLWCQLEGLISSGHMVDQCDKLKRLLYDSLLNHLKQLKVDSDDAVSSAS